MSPQIVRYKKAIEILNFVKTPRTFREICRNLHVKETRLNFFITKLNRFIKKDTDMYVVRREFEDKEIKNLFIKTDYEPVVKAEARTEERTYFKDAPVVKTARSCRKCKAQLDASRYFNCEKCIPQLALDEGDLVYEHTTTRISDLSFIGGWLK